MHKYYCYIQHQEAIYSWTGEAPGTVQAAMKAAAANDVPGTWTVVPMLEAGFVVEVDITESKVYTGTNPRPADPAGEVNDREYYAAECMGSAPHAEHTFNGGMYCPGNLEAAELGAGS